VRIVIEFPNVRRVLADQFHRERKGARGIHVVVIKDLVVHGAGLQDVSLQSDLESNGLFVIHDGSADIPVDEL
jgi:hypothetical protein